MSTEGSMWVTVEMLDGRQRDPAPEKSCCGGSRGGQECWDPGETGRPSPPHGRIALVESGNRGWDGLRQEGIGCEDSAHRMEKGGRRGCQP